MAQFAPHKSEIESFPASLVFIAAEKRGGLFKPEEYLLKNPTPFPFLLDEDRRVTKAYGVYQRLRMDAINIARPATFIVDTQGKVRYLYVGKSQSDRAAVAEVIETLRSALQVPSTGY